MPDIGRGGRISSGGQDTFTVDFHLPTAGADSADTVTTTAETAMIIGFIPTTTGATITTPLTTWTAPWPCRIKEVFCEGQLLASGDIIRYRVRRHDLAAYATADDIIRNSEGGAAVDYVHLTATAANQYQRQRYTGVLQDDSVRPDFTDGSETAVGFNPDEVELAAGDRLSATYAMAAAGDAASHIRCTVTLSKLE